MNAAEVMVGLEALIAKAKLADEPAMSKADVDTLRAIRESLAFVEGSPGAIAPVTTVRALVEMHRDCRAILRGHAYEGMRTQTAMRHLLDDLGVALAACRTLREQLDVGQARVLELESVMRQQAEVVRAAAEILKETAR